MGSKRPAGELSEAVRPEISAALLVPIADAGRTRAQLDEGPFEPTCSLENVVNLKTSNGQAAQEARYSVVRGTPSKLIGFGTVKSKGEVLGPFTLWLAGATVFKVSGATTLERPDVAAFFKAPGMAMAGYQIDLDTQPLPPGDYAVFLQGSSGASLCPTHHTVRVQ